MAVTAHGDSGALTARRAATCCRFPSKIAVQRSSPAKEASPLTRPRADTASQSLAGTAFIAHVRKCKGQYHASWPLLPFPTGLEPAAMQKRTSDASSTVRHPSRPRPLAASSGGAYASGRELRSHERRATATAAASETPGAVAATKSATEISTEALRICVASCGVIRNVYGKTTAVHARRADCCGLRRRVSCIQKGGAYLQRPPPRPAIYHSTLQLSTIAGALSLTPPCYCVASPSFQARISGRKLPSHIPAQHTSARVSRTSKEAPQRGRCRPQRQQRPHFHPSAAECSLRQKQRQHQAQHVQHCHLRYGHGNAGGKTNVRQDLIDYHAAHRQEERDWEVLEGRKQVLNSSNNTDSDGNARPGGTRPSENLESPQSLSGGCLSTCLSRPHRQARRRWGWKLALVMCLLQVCLMRSFARQESTRCAAETPATNEVKRATLKSKLSCEFDPSSKHALIRLPSAAAAADGIPLVFKPVDSMICGPRALMDDLRTSCAKGSSPEGGERAPVSQHSNGGAVSRQDETHRVTLDENIVRLSAAVASNHHQMTMPPLVNHAENATPAGPVFPVLHKSIAAAVALQMPQLSREERSLSRHMSASFVGAGHQQHKQKEAPSPQGPGRRQRTQQHQNAVAESTFTEESACYCETTPENVATTSKSRQQEIQQREPAEGSHATGGDVRNRDQSPSDTSWTGDDVQDLALHRGTQHASTGALTHDDNKGGPTVSKNLLPAAARTAPAAAQNRSSGGNEARPSAIERKISIRGDLDAPPDTPEGIYSKSDGSLEQPYQFRHSTSSVQPRFSGKMFFNRTAPVVELDASVTLSGTLGFVDTTRRSSSVIGSVSGELSPLVVAQITTPISSSLENMRDFEARKRVLQQRKQQPCKRGFGHPSKQPDKTSRLVLAGSLRIGSEETDPAPRTTNVAVYRSSVPSVEDALRVAGTAPRRSLYANEEEGHKPEKQPAGASHAAEPREKLIEPARAVRRVKREFSTDAVKGRPTPATKAADSSPDSENEVVANHDNESSSAPSLKMLKQPSLPHEQQPHAARRPSQQSMQQFLSLNDGATHEGPTGTDGQVPRWERQAAGGRQISSIAALRELLGELSVAARKRRQEAAGRRKARDVEPPPALIPSRQTATILTPARITSPSVTSVNETAVASVAYITQSPRRFPYAAVPTRDDVESPVATTAAAAPRARAAREDGTEGEERKEFEGEARGSCQERNEDREILLWDIESVEEAYDVPEEPDGEVNNEDGRTDFFQRREEEAARRAKLVQLNASGVTVPSPGTGSVSPRAASLHAAEKSATPQPITCSAAEPMETSIMKKMWKTREQLSDLAKKQLRTFNSAATRRQVCALIQSDQLQYKLWLTLASLYVIEWPFYSYADGGGVHFLRELLEQTRAFAAPPGSSQAVQQRYEEFRSCKMPAALEEGLLTLMDCLPSGAELPAALAVASEHPGFARLIRALGDVHVPLDNYHSLAHVFDIVEAAMGLAWGKNIFIGKAATTSPSFKPFTAEELFDKYTYAFSQSRRYFSIMILLFRAMRQHVTQKPHTGIILLLVEQPESPRSKTDPFHQLQDFRILQAQIRQSVLMKLESALMRFYPYNRGSTRKEMVDLPDIRVSGFFARNGDGRTVEKGLVGVEIDFSLIERFKEETPQYGVMIQVNLLDTWAEKNSPEAWPDVLEPYNTVLSAYTATQLLKSELLWDPSLASLAWGRTKFLYSSITEVFEFEKAREFSPEKRAPPYDPDLHVMLLQSYTDFVTQGRDQGVMEHLISALKRKPIGHARIPRTFDAERVILQGSAMLLNQAPVRITEGASSARAAGSPGKVISQSSKGDASTALTANCPCISTPQNNGGGVLLSGELSANARGFHDTRAPATGSVPRQLLGGDTIGTTATNSASDGTSIEGRALKRRHVEAQGEREEEEEAVRTRARRHAGTELRDDRQEECHREQKRQLYRKKEFGSGLNYGEVLQIEQAIRENTIMLHIKIKGLGHTAAEEWRSLRAHEILNRLAQRLRGAFEIHYVEAAKPRPVMPFKSCTSVHCSPGNNSLRQRMCVSIQPSKPPQFERCEGMVPSWILTVSVCATAAFFVCCLALLVHHNNLELPWWLLCICSRFSPWEKEATDTSSSSWELTSDCESANASPLALIRRSAMTHGVARSVFLISEPSSKDDPPQNSAAVACLIPASVGSAPMKNLRRGRRPNRRISRRIGGRTYWQTSLPKRKSSPRRYNGSLVPARNTKSRNLSKVATVREPPADFMHSSSTPRILGCPALGCPALRTGRTVGHQKLNTRVSTATSHIAPGGSRGRTAKLQVVRANLAAVHCRDECTEGAPFLWSQELLETTILPPPEPNDSQHLHAEEQRLRQQARNDTSLLVEKSIRRVTKASRAVLEKSLCSPPAVFARRDAETTWVREIPTGLASSSDKQRRIQSVPPTCRRSVSPNSSRAGIGSGGKYAGIR